MRRDSLDSRANRASLKHSGCFGDYSTAPELARTLAASENFAPAEGELRHHAHINVGSQGRGRGKRVRDPQSEKTTKKKKPAGFDMFSYFQRKPDKDDDGRPPPGRFDSYEGDGGGGGISV